MYADFYGLTEDPFRLTPDRHYCFEHPSFRKAGAYLRYGVQRAEGFIMVTGRPGTGKTTLINTFLSDLPADSYRVARLLSTRLEGGDLIRMVAYAFDLPAERKDKATVLRELERTLKRDRLSGRRGLLIVDEAQDLPASALEELRLLTNLEGENTPLLQIFLVGQEELRDIVGLPQMEQLHQRLIAACHLNPLTLKESFAYVRYRLQKARWDGDPVIAPNVFGALVQASGGIPRRINQICSRLLMHGFVEEKHQLGIGDLRTVLAELRAERLLPQTREDDGLDQASDDSEQVPAMDLPEPGEEVEAPEAVEDDGLDLDWAVEAHPRQEEEEAEADAMGIDMDPPYEERLERLTPGQSPSVTDPNIYARAVDYWSDAGSPVEGRVGAAEEVTSAQTRNGRFQRLKRLLPVIVLVLLAAAAGFAASIPSLRQWTLEQALGMQQAAGHWLAHPAQGEARTTPPDGASAPESDESVGSGWPTRLSRFAYRGDGAG